MRHFGIFVVARQVFQASVIYMAVRDRDPSAPYFHRIVAEIGRILVPSDEARVVRVLGQIAHVKQNVGSQQVFDRIQQGWCGAELEKPLEQNMGFDREHPGTSLP